MASNRQKRIERTPTEGRDGTQKHHYYMWTLQCFHYCISHNFVGTFPPSIIIKAQLKSGLLLNNIKLSRKYRDGFMEN